MMRTFLPKLIVLPAVVFSTWWLTSSMMAKAQQPKYRAAKETPAPPEGGSKVAVASYPAEIKSAGPGFHPKLTSLNRLDHYSVNVQGGVAQVQASVSMMSRVQGPSHIWRLKVTDVRNDAVISDVSYTDQSFKIERSGLMNPTFAEELPLPSGKYRVVLSLYMIPAGVKASDMLKADPIQLLGNTLINAPKIIEVL